MSISIQDIYGPFTGTPTPSSPRRATPGAVSTTEVPEKAPEVQKTFAVVAASNPVYGLVVVLAALVALYYIARAMPGAAAEEFRNIKVTPYNALVIALAAIVGINILKWIFTMFPVKHVSAFVLSA